MRQVALGEHLVHPGHPEDGVLSSDDGEFVRAESGRLLRVLVNHASDPSSGDLQLRHGPNIGQLYREKIWDHAAGTLIIEEAGGQVTDMRGGILDFGTGRLLLRNHGVIASNGHLHAAVLDVLRGVAGQS